MTGFAAGMGQMGAGVGSAIGLALTDSPKNPYGSRKRVSKNIDNTFVPSEGGGFRTGFNTIESGKPYGFYVTPSAERTDYVNALSNVYGTGANEAAGLLADVRPGYGRLTDAAVTAVQHAREKGIQDVTGQLERRRILGSSFGMDTLARAEREYGDAENEARAKAFVAELDAYSKILDQKTTYAAKQYQTHLDELGLEAKLAFGLSEQMQGSINNASTLMNQMAYEEQQARNAAWVGAAANFVGGASATAGAGIDTAGDIVSSYGMGGGM